MKGRNRLSERLKKIEDNPSGLILEQNVQIRYSEVLHIHRQIFEEYFG